MKSKWYDTLVRTGRTFVQGALAIGTLSATSGVNADLPHVLLGAAYAGAVAVLMAFAFPVKPPAPSA